MFSYTWLIIGAILVAIELSTGTFYLLMLAVAAITAWLFQFTGATFLVQAVVFLITSGVLVTFLHRYRAQKSLTNTVNIADQLDAGEIVHVSEWQDGIGITHYRGASWQVILETPQDSPQAGAYRIVKFEGSRLMVKPEQH